jgi:hypothetical protein
MFNVKWLHIGSVTVFATGSAVCGAAPNMNALIIGRVIAGTGGAGMYLGMLNLVAINTTARERPVYMGGTGVVWGTGTILGVLSLVVHLPIRVLHGDGWVFPVTTSSFPMLIIVPRLFT